MRAALFRGLLIAAGFLLGISVQVAAQDAPSLKWPAIAYLASAASDQATTIAVLRRYPLAREVDPIYAWTVRNNAARILAGTAIDVGVVLLARRVHRTHPTLAVFALSALAGVRMVQTAQNVRLSTGQRRNDF